MATDTTALETAALDELRTQLRGSALTSSDAGFGDIRAVFNAMHLGQPDLIVCCTGTADVVDAVNFARAQGMTVAIRGGGHSIAGLSAIDGGMLIDLSPMSAVQVEPERRIARAQGGALWGDLDRETQAFGLATPVAWSPTRVSPGSRSAADMGGSAGSTAFRATTSWKRRSCARTAR